MKKQFSPAWVSSTQPRKQRKYRYNAPLHLKHRMLSAHLSKELRKDYGKRSLPVRKEDEVVIIRGSHKGAKGKVTKVSLDKSKIYIENIKRKKVSGQEVEIAFDPSNVVITKLALDDGKRKHVLEKSRAAKEKKTKEQKGKTETVAKK